MSGRVLMRTARIHAGEGEVNGGTDGSGGGCSGSLCKVLLVWILNNVLPTSGLIGKSGRVS
eukprot:321030-Rhodomonas_salina.2